MRVLGTNRPDTMVKDLQPMRPTALCEHLRAEAGQYGADVAVWSDKTYKVTLRVRDADPDAAKTVAKALYSTVDKHSVQLLNEVVADTLRHTPQRWLVILLSLLACAFVCSLYVLFDALISRDDDADVQ